MFWAHPLKIRNYFTTIPPCVETQLFYLCLRRRSPTILCRNVGVLKVRCLVIIIIIIIFIYCSWVVTLWQWLFYMFYYVVRKTASLKIILQRAKKMEVRGFSIWTLGRKRTWFKFLFRRNPSNSLF